MGLRWDDKNASGWRVALPNQPRPDAPNPTGCFPRPVGTGRGSARTGPASGDGDRSTKGTAASPRPALQPQEAPMTRDEYLTAQRRQSEERAEWCGRLSAALERLVTSAEGVMRDVAFAHAEEALAQFDAWKRNHPAERGFCVTGCGAAQQVGNLCRSCADRLNRPSHPVHMDGCALNECGCCTCDPIELPGLAS